MTKSINAAEARGYRTAGLVSLYSVLVVGGVVFALVWDTGVRTASGARDEVQVALKPDAAVVVERALLGAANAQVGTLKGVVTFGDDVPMAKLLVKKGDPTAKDAAVCAAQDVPDEELVVNKENKGIANVFVYLDKAPAGAEFGPPAAAEIVFDQMACRFLPHAMTVQVGQKVLVKSGDPVPHNTHTSPLKNKDFNQSIAPNDRAGVDLKYTKAERLPTNVKCDVHPWMKAYHLVKDHPYMAVTDADGKFTIPNLPAGKHEFIVWQEKKGYLDKKYVVEIKAGKDTEVKLSYKASQFAAFEGPAPKTVVIAPGK